MEQIVFYEGRGYFLSNFSSFAIEWGGYLCATSEHHYQASKFTDESIRKLIREARSAHDSKKLAEAHQDNIRPDWDDEMKLAVMESILRAKLEQHPYIVRKLLETGDAFLVEDSPKDSFWGRGPDWKGKNHLGRLWMKLRAERRVNVA